MLNGDSLILLDVMKVDFTTCFILLDELLFCRPCVGSDRHSPAVIANGRVQSMVNPWETCG